MTSVKAALSGEHVAHGRIAAQHTAHELCVSFLLASAIILRTHLIQPTWARRPDASGHKHSGYGCHSGTDGWRQFSSPKSIVNRAPAK